MFERYVFSSLPSLAARDRKMAAIKSRLSLAYAAGNRMEVTRLSRQLKKLGQSLC